jgi:hypothetical protein
LGRELGLKVPVASLSNRPAAISQHRRVRQHGAQAKEQHSSPDKRRKMSVCKAGRAPSGQDGDRQLAVRNRGGRGHGAENQEQDGGQADDPLFAQEFQELVVRVAGRDPSPAVDALDIGSRRVLDAKPVSTFAERALRRAPSRHREIRQDGLAHEVHVLDLDIAGRAFRIFEQQVDARIPAVFHLAPRRWIAGKLRDRSGRDRLGDDAIAMRGVDAYELAPLPKSTSTSSHECGNLRVALSDCDSHTRDPGAARPVIEPGLATWTVTVSPLGSTTSARNRL